MRELIDYLPFEWAVLRVCALMLSELLLVVESLLAGFDGTLKNHSKRINEHTSLAAQPFVGLERPVLTLNTIVCELVGLSGRWNF